MFNNSTVNRAGKSRSERRTKIELRALEVFVAVAETGNMTIAARKLAMTQPAVSQILKHLEDAVGSPLLDRELRPLRLTPSGTAVFARAKQLLWDAERLYREVQLASDCGLPRFRIGFVDSFAATAGPHLIKSLGDDVDQLLVWSGIAPELREEFLGRDLDLIISPDPLDGIENIECRRILRESFVLILPNALRHLAKSLSLPELAKRHPLVRFSGRSLMGAQIDRHLHWQRIEAAKRLEFDTSESVIGMVAEGVGWAIVTPLSLVQAPGAFLKIFPVPMPGPVLARSLYVAYRPGEFGGMPERIATQCSLIFNKEIRPKLLTLAHWLGEHFQEQ
jgi:DNA-binding transcriptional LysR family regulator